MEVLIASNEIYFSYRHIPIRENFIYLPYNIDPSSILIFDSTGNPLGFRTEEKNEFLVLIFPPQAHLIYFKFHTAILTWSYVYNEGKLSFFASLNIIKGRWPQFDKGVDIRLKIDYKIYTIPSEIILQPGWHKFKLFDLPAKLDAFIKTNENLNEEIVKVIPTLTIETDEILPDGPLYLIDQNRVCQQSLIKNKLEASPAIIKDISIKTKRDQSILGRDDLFIIGHYIGDIPNYQVNLYHPQLQGSGLFFEGNQCQNLGLDQRRILTLPNKRDFTFHSIYKITS